MVNPDIDIINKQLAEVYGTDLVHAARWKLTWSGDPLEKRLVAEPVMSGSIFVSFFSGVKEKPKYPEGSWGKCWILERLLFSKPPEDIVNWDGYEPFWSFVTGPERTPIQPNWYAVNFIVQMALYGPRETLSQAYDREEKKWKDETAQVREMIDDDLPWRIMQMKHGEGVVVPNNFKPSGEV